MIPGILVQLLTLVGTMMTAMNIVREREIGTLDQLNVTPISRSASSARSFSRSSPSQCSSSAQGSSWRDGYSACR